METGIVLLKLTEKEVVDPTKMNSKQMMVIFVVLASIYLVQAEVITTDCETASCRGVLGKEDPIGVLTDCWNTTQSGKRKTACAIIYVSDPKQGIMNTATNPSCDNCFVTKTEEGMKMCEKFEKTYAKVQITAREFCLEGATPYFCNAGKT